MLSVNHILVPHDFSDFSEHALRYGLELARRCDATLHLLYAEVLHGDDAPQPGERPFEALRERIDVRFHEEGSATYRGEPIDVRRSVKRDVAAAPAIVSYAEDHAIDLIVMGTHGRRGVRRLLLGSVAAEVVRMAGCPVMTVRGSDDTRTLALPVRSILAPVDFSKHARKAVQFAKEVAALLGARLDLLHVVEDDFHPAFYGVTVGSIYDLDPNIDQKAERELQALDVATAITGLDVETAYHVRSGYAAREINAFAKEQDSDLIVMSTHGLRGLEHFFLGSVAEKVVRRAPVPVLTVKAFGKQLVDDAARAAEAVSED